MKNRAYRAFINSQLGTDDFVIRRDLFWLCQRHLRKEDAVGLAARRVVDNPTQRTAAWVLDLQVVIDATWETRYGHYVSSLRAQGAALRMEERLKAWAA